MDWLLAQDRALLLWINGLHTPFGDVFMRLVSHKFIWIPFYALLLVLLVRAKGWKTAALAIGIVILGIVLSDQITSGLLKPWVHRPRPCHVPGLADALHLVNKACGGAFGFASSHASNFFCLATLMTGLLKGRYRYLGVALFASAGLVAFSRVYLGVHYPGDVLAGMGIGILIGWLGMQLFNIIHKKLDFPQTAQK